MVTAKRGTAHGDREAGDRAWGRLPGMPRATAECYERDVHDVARRLLGARVAHAGVTVRLTEVEAYAGIGDPGSHGFRGPTPRTQVLFGPPGGLYVYFTYGMHWCANLVTGPEGGGAAVLLRAGEVVDGAAKAAQQRAGVRPRDWARGPARLARCLALTGAHNGIDTLAADAPFVVELADPLDARLIRQGSRVGVSGPGGDGTAYPWRYWIDGDPTVSLYRPGKVRRARTPG